MSGSTEKLLAERRNTHGEYADHARCTQAILRACQAEKNWPILSDIMKESIHMIAHKLGRIVSGTPDVADHWADIAGYAVLVQHRIENPVEAYPSDDIWSALARGWNCSIEEAKQRANYQVEGRKKSAEMPRASELTEAQETMKKDMLSAPKEPKLKPLPSERQEISEHYLAKSLEKISAEDL